MEAYYFVSYAASIAIPQVPFGATPRLISPNPASPQVVPQLFLMMNEVGVYLYNTMMIQFKF